MVGSVDLSALLGSGVYLLSYHGTIVYVGQSRKLIQRLYAHEYAWRTRRKAKGAPAWLRQYKAMQFDRIVVVPCPIPELDALERRLIAEHQPKHNVMHKAKPERVPVTLEVRGLTLTLGGPVLPAMRPPPVVEVIPRRAVL